MARIEPEWLKWSLDEKHIAALETISAHVRNKWKGEVGPLWHTAHDASHSEQVAVAVQQLIPDPGGMEMNQEERFCVLAAAWLHDIGMIVKGNEDPEEVRRTHHDRSRDYIWDSRRDLGLDDTQAGRIGDIAWYHRKETDISACQNETGGFRRQVLAAYLRLADAISIDTPRVEKKQSIFKLLLAVGMPTGHRFHWIKSFYARSARPNPREKKIEVRFISRERTRSDIKRLAKIVCDEIRDELFTVRDVILRGPFTQYFDVVEELEEFGGAGIGEYDMYLPHLLGNIDLHRGNPASSVASTLVNSVLALMEQVDPQDAFISVQDYAEQVVDKVCKERSCHLLLKKIRGKIVRHIGSKPKSREEAAIAIKDLKNELTTFLAEREAKIGLLVKYARPFLMDEGTILLFGYSTLILRALADIQDDTKARTPVFVLECRSKSRFNLQGEVVYCDGEEYAIQVRRSGFKQVCVVPDIAVANLMARGLVNKVLFGANGIDLADGTFGHTAGHRMIADLAQVYDVPVYVISDSDKIGQFEPAPDSDRTEAWLRMSKRASNRLDYEKVGLLNPREDVVEGKKIRMLITDLGAFPPNRIPPKLAEDTSSGATSG